MPEAAREEGRLARWSRLKRESKAVPAVVDAPEEPPVEPDPLPDVETLDGESDFSAFLGKDVPEDLHRLALRKLWKTNPLFSGQDGLDDYAEDFSVMEPLAEEVVEQLKKALWGEEDSETEDTEAGSPREAAGEVASRPCDAPGGPPVDRDDDEDGDEDEVEDVDG